MTITFSPPFQNTKLFGDFWIINFHKVFFAFKRFSDFWLDRI